MIRSVDESFVDLSIISSFFYSNWSKNRSTLPGMDFYHLIDRVMKQYPQDIEILPNEFGR